jgi:hypothetical protein
LTFRNAIIQEFELTVIIHKPWTQINSRGRIASVVAEFLVEKNFEYRQLSTAKTTALLVFHLIDVKIYAIGFRAKVSAAPNNDPITSF